MRTVLSVTLGFAGVALVLNPFGERLAGVELIALASGFFNDHSGTLLRHKLAHDPIS